MIGGPQAHAELLTSKLVEAFAKSSNAVACAPIDPALVKYASRGIKREVVLAIDDLKSVDMMRRTFNVFAHDFESRRPKVEIGEGRDLTALFGVISGRFRQSRGLVDLAERPQSESARKISALTNWS